MESLIYRFFFDNWQRKLVAVVSALIIWLFVNQQITDSKTIRNVPIRIVNLPTDRTIIGLLPNGILHKKIALTLSGTKDVINELEPGDLEVLIDASTIDHNDWIAQITKKNIVSLNPAIDLANNITEVDHTEFVLKLNRLVTVKVPIKIMPPKGDAPAGYEFLDVWPQRLLQTISGPEEELQKLQIKGLEVTFDLNEITKAELDNLKAQYEDEVSFVVPIKWKHVNLSYRNNAQDEINDPEAQGLRLDFLRKASYSLGKEVSIQLFFPLRTIDSLNPEKLSLDIKTPIAVRDGITIFTVPLFAKNVSKLFIDIIKDNLQLVIVAAPTSEREFLQWSYEVVNQKELEDTYIAFMIAQTANTKNPMSTTLIKKRENLLRQRFQTYMANFNLLTESNRKLMLESKIQGDHIILMSY